MENLKIVHVVAGLWKENGGPSVVIPNLCLSQYKKGCDVSIVTVDGNHSDELIFAQKNGVKVYSFRAMKFLPIRYSIGMSKVLRDLVKDADIVHNHGLWLYPNWLAYKWSKYYNKKLVFTPHGVLDPNLFLKKRYKKLLPWLLFDKKLVEYSSKVYALSCAEKNAILKTIDYVENKIDVIPNGVFIKDEVQESYILDKFKDDKKLLFLSRVAPIKGVTVLLDVWKNNYTKFSNWKLLIAGPINNELKELFNDLEDLSKYNIHVFGSVYGNDKDTLFKKSDIFVLPSFGEGLPTALLEALSYSKPIIYTDECNFEVSQDIVLGEKYNSHNDIKGLEKSILHMVSKTNEELEVMGKNGEKLIKDKFSWDKVSQDMIHSYRSIL